MHELALSRTIVDTVLRHAAGRPVRAVRLEVGALRQIIPEYLAFNLEIVARGTACEGAVFEQEAIAARLRCDRCEREWDPAPEPAEDEEHLTPVPRFRCPGCGEGGAEVVAGDQLLVESIDVEEAPCTARG